MSRPTGLNDEQTGGQVARSRVRRDSNGDIVPKALLDAVFGKRTAEEEAAVKRRREAGEECVLDHVFGAKRFGLEGSSRAPSTKAPGHSKSNNGQTRQLSKKDDKRAVKHVSL